MEAVKQIVLWLALALGCFIPASKLTPTATENRVWEIFSIGYDAPTAEVTDLGSRTETSTLDYDTAPIHSAITDEIPTEANRFLFGQNAEFKAANEEIMFSTRSASSGVTPPQEWIGMTYEERIAATIEKYGFNLGDAKVRFDPTLTGNLTYGATAKNAPLDIRVTYNALRSEEDLATTIAHELRHSRAYLGSGENTEKAAIESQEALREYIKSKK